MSFDIRSVWNVCVVSLMEYTSRLTDEIRRPAPYPLGHRTVIICARDTGVIGRTFDVVFIRQTYGRFLGRVGR